MTLKLEPKMNPQTPIRVYRKPPVVEALCEFFMEGSEWDDTVLGRFFDRVKEKFPKRRQVELQQAEFLISQKGHSAAGIRRLPPQMQFLNENETSILQLRRDLLVVNQLAPYTKFEDWEQNIYSALKIYWELTNPKGVSKIGLRYINRICIAEFPIRMEDYFNVYPQLPKQTGESHGAFMIRIELPCAQPGHGLLVTFASTPPDYPGPVAHLLDFYGTFKAESVLNEQAVRPHIRTLHANLNRAFEGSITDKLRKLFEPID